MDRVEEILAQCPNVLPGHGPKRSMKAILQTLADSLEGTEYLDNYGEGDYIAAFESEVAELFGQEAAVFMPSGTMAQQIALRIWCQRRNNFTVAMHPTAHPEYAERLGYRFLHRLQRLQFGAPEFASDRLLTIEDFQQLGEEPGAILLELPYRPLGGQLPQWDELLALKSWAEERGIPLHLDGARIWQCRPFYQKSYQEIAALFDSIYVSFYKDLGGLNGCMLMGPAALIDEARVWQKRHGGQLKTMGPYVASARLGLQQVLPQIDQWVVKAQEVAAVFASYERMTVKPDPPHVNIFQLFVQGDHETLNERHLALAEETGTFLFYRFKPSEVPGVATLELHCWENAMRFDMAKLRPFVDRLLKEWFPPTESIGKSNNKELANLASNQDSPLPIHRYAAAGGVVVHNQKVLLLDRPVHQEIRLPKGHIRPGELPSEAALREVSEESGYQSPLILAVLGEQTVAFDYEGEHVIRSEYYFLMALAENSQRGRETEFEPLWLSWEDALKQVTFEAEREWVRRARAVASKKAKETDAS